MPLEGVLKPIGEAYKSNFRGSTTAFYKNAFRLLS
jgi:hypothetical protein